MWVKQNETHVRARQRLFSGNVIGKGISEDVTCHLESESWEGACHQWLGRSNPSQGRRWAQGHEGAHMAGVSGEREGGTRWRQGRRTESRWCSFWVGWRMQMCFNCSGKGWECFHLWSRMIWEGLSKSYFWVHSVKQGTEPQRDQLGAMCVFQWRNVL